MLKSIFLFCFSILLFSCRTQFPIAYDSNKAKNPDYKSYIKPKKGDMVVGDAIQIKNQNKMFKSSVFTLNGMTFKTKEIQEYQDVSGLYVNLDGGLTKALTGPGINVFRKTNLNSSFDASGHMNTQTNNYFYIKKEGQDDYKLVTLGSAKTLKGWVQDNNEAYEQASLALKYGKRVKMHQIFNWVGIIGGLTLIAVDPSNGENGSKNVSAMSYAGLGMMCGGIINLPINGFFRRAKAGRAYANAINIYNDTPVNREK